MNHPSAPEIPTWFNDGASHIALLNEAMSWVGTPFLANGRAKGQGVCCHMLCYEIYYAIGALPEWGDLPRSSSSIGDQRKINRMSQWLSTRPEFAAIDPAVSVSGDLLTLRLVSGENHMGIRLIGGRLVHVTRWRGVCIHNLSDPTWAERIVAAWRVLP